MALKKAQRFPGLGAGLVATLDRVNGSGQRNGLVTVEQLEASHAIEVERLQNLLKAAREQLREARAQNETLVEQLNQQTSGDAAPVKSRLVSQVEAAAILHVQPYTISRWVKAGHFTLVNVPGRKHPLIDAASLRHPPRKSRK